MYLKNNSLVLKLIDLAFKFRSYKKFNLLNSFLIAITLSPFLFLAAYNAALYAINHFLIQTLLAPSQFLRERLDEFKAGQLPVTIVFFWAYPTKFFIDASIVFLMFFEAIYYFFFLSFLWVFSLGGVPFQPYYHQAETEFLKTHKVNESVYPNWIQYTISTIYAIIIFGPLVVNLTTAAIEMNNFRNIITDEISETLTKDDLANGSVLGQTYIIELERFYSSYTEVTVGDKAYYIYVNYNPANNFVESGFGREVEYKNFVREHELSTLFDGIRTRTIG